jgi:hypothetical protein
MGGMVIINMETVARIKKLHGKHREQGHRCQFTEYGKARIDVHPDLAADHQIKQQDAEAKQHQGLDYFFPIYGHLLLQL